MAYITIVRKGDLFSNHSSFKTACIAYGWNYDNLKRKSGGVPLSVGDYIVERQEKEMTIECQRLAAYLITPFYQAHDWDGEGEDGDNVKVIFEFGESRDYIIEAWISIESEINEVATDAVGHDLEYVDTTVYISHIVSVIDHDGTEVKMTEKVYDFLMRQLKV